MKPKLKKNSNATFADLCDVKVDASYAEVRVGDILPFHCPALDYLLCDGLGRQWEWLVFAKGRGERR